MGIKLNNIDGDLAVTGNVGIGIANPLGNLHVFNTAESKIIIDRDPGNDGTNYVPVGTSVGGIHFRSADYSWTSQKTGASIEAFPGSIGYSGSCHDIRFRTKANQAHTNLTDRMTIKYDGRVGIGTTSPVTNCSLHCTNTIVAHSRGEGIELGYHEIKLTNNGSAHWSIVNNGSLLFKDTSSSDQFGTAGTTKMYVTTSGALYVGSTAYWSDDRIKKNEVHITNALETIAKLKPQKYDKYLTQDSSDNILQLTDEFTEESGLIAQEVYYDVPELRHLVTVPKDADLSGNPITTSSDPQVDPDYSNWGSEPASLNYSGFTAYLIKGIQEQQEIIQAEKNKVSNLESQVASLRSEFNDLLSKFNTLETTIQNN